MKRSLVNLIKYPPAKALKHQNIDLMRTFQRRKKLKWMAWPTLIVFFVTMFHSESALLAQAATVPGVEVQLRLPGTSLLAEKLPAEFGRALEVHPASAKGRPFIVLLQDAHANPEAQKNIRNILRWADQQSAGPVTAALEGARGEIHPEYLDFFPGQVSGMHPGKLSKGEKMKG